MGNSHEHALGIDLREEGIQQQSHIQCGCETAFTAGQANVDGEDIVDDSTCVME